MAGGSLPFSPRNLYWGINLIFAPQGCSLARVVSACREGGTFIRTTSDEIRR